MTWAMQLACIGGVAVMAAAALSAPVGRATLTPATGAAKVGSSCSSCTARHQRLSLRASGPRDETE